MSQAEATGAAAEGDRQTAGASAAATDGDSGGLPPGSPVLVTGAAGFIGKRVVQLLLKAGHRVRCLDLPGKLNSTLWPAAGESAPELVPVDLADKNSAAQLIAAVKDIRTVVHLAGVMQEFDGSIDEINVNGSKRLIDACEKGDVRRFLYISSTGAESGRSKYLRACLEIEQVLQQQNRMEEIILRCSPVFGVGDHFLTPIIKLFRSKKPAIPCLLNGWQVFNPIFVDDVATIVGKLVADVKSPPQIYQLGGVQPIELLDVMGLVQVATQRVKCILHSPPFLTPLLLPLGNLLWPEARITLDYANTLAKDTLLVEGEANHAPALLQSRPALLEQELPRVVEQTP